MSAEVYLWIAIGFAFLAAEFIRRDGDRKSNYGGYVVVSVIVAAIFASISGCTASEQAARENKHKAGTVHEVAEKSQPTPP
jgi:hypothetical protein